MTLACSGNARPVSTVLAPVEPMLARLVRTLPVGDDLSYEPKWDGFRCLSFPGAMTADLFSRQGRPFTRYFPEIAAAVHALGDVVLDGELIVRTADRAADFPALMERLHPAASRVTMLAATTPAELVVFDVLSTAGGEVMPLPYEERRRLLERLLGDPPPGVHLTPRTTDADEANQWLTSEPGSGIDGVMVKAAGSPYQPGKRTMVKVKLTRTADCVVAGLRVHQDGSVGSLLLGQHDERGLLRHVGVAASFPKALRAELGGVLAPLVVPLEGHPWARGFGLEGGVLGRLKGTAGRWEPSMPRDWLPVRPELVAEVGYDHREGYRFRHPARFVRWRPDRDPCSCVIGPET